MKSFARVCLAAVLLAGVPAWAGNTSSGPACLDGHYSLSGTISDPFSNFLPSDLDTASFELSRTYSIDLKAFKADDSQYQFRAVDNRGWGAGYSSPYLWEVGRGPGPSMQSSGWGNFQMDGRAYSPIPMGR